MRLRGELLTDLLAQSPAALATIVARAGRLGHDLHRPHAVLVVRADSAPNPTRTGGSTHSVRCCRPSTRWHPGRASPLAARHGDDVVVLWPWTCRPSTVPPGHGSDAR
ncbi:hypothetical protein SAZ11_04475 [Streptomyces sp. FXJ1.4098]|nr:hypothetical protein [Streptomyces sp. FXJ1.4098]